MNFGELKTLITAFSKRSDTKVTDQLDNFVLLAEGIIARDIRAIEMVTSADFGETDRASGAIYTLPTDWLGHRAMTGTNNGQKYKLKHVGLEELNRYPTSGVPQIYTTYGTKLEFRASPATDSDFTLIYYARPAALSADSDTNLLLTNHPGLYIKAAMAELYGFIEDFESADKQVDAYGYDRDQVNALVSEARGSGSIAPSYNYESGSTM